MALETHFPSPKFFHGDSLPGYTTPTLCTLLRAWEEDSEEVVKEAWNNLPMICGLPDWDDLHNERFPVHDEDSYVHYNDEDFYES